MYLHKDDKELLRDIIVTVSERTGIDESIVEKDYYVTMILKELVQRNPNVVFKGGTSLSKAYHVIDRFSEDIDITFEEHLGEARRKKIKYQLLQPISEDLDLEIDNWKSIESDKDYNHYDFVYDSVCSEDKKGLRPYVKLETALMSYSYPTEEKEITSIIFDCLETEESEILRDYGLEPFKMKTQTLSRTIIDKIFAVCDYYMVGRAPAGDRSVYNYENGNEIKKIDYTSGQKDVPYYDIVIKSPDENVLIKAELDDKFLTEVEKKYRSKVKRREE